MKKIFTLIAATLMAVGANAQTYDFSSLTSSDFTVDENGEMTTYTLDGVNGPSINYKTANADMNFTVKGLSFQFKNSKTKDNAVKTGSGFLQMDAKNFYIIFNDVAVGSIITLNVSAKGSTDSNFSTTFEGCTADAGNPATVTKAADLESYTVLKFTATASTVKIRETGGGFRISKAIVSTGGGGEPATAHVATTYDYTTISTADIALLDADVTKWTKTTEGTAPNQFVRYSIAGEWAAKVSGAFGADVALVANGTELDYAKGLVFARNANALKDGNIRIDCGKRLSINATGIRMTIANLAKNDVVKVRFSSTGDEERGFEVTNADKTSISSSSSEPIEETLTAAADGAMTLVTTKGLYLYALTINAALPTGITDVKVVEPSTIKDDAIYNLSGQKVNENYKGVVIKNGVKTIQK